MSAGLDANGGGWSVPTNSRTVVTTTRVRDDIETTLTNINAKSDAWGKIIPMSFGRCRVGGALIWSSNFYKTTETYDDVTTTQNLIDWYNVPTVVPVPYIKSESDGGQTIAWGDPLERTVIGPPDFEKSTQVRNSGSQVTHGSETGSNIDLCYSFGVEGDPRQKRYVEKIRINDIIVYDTTTDYLADGLALSIRYGYDNAPPALMERYDNGKFHYKNQTLIVFDRFPLAQFGDSIPDSVDVEFGCCAAIASTHETGCGPVSVYTKQLSRDNPNFTKFTDGFGADLHEGDLIVCSVVVSKPGGDNAFVNPDFEMIAAQSGQDLDCKVFQLLMTSAMMSKYAGKEMQLLTPYVAGHTNLDPATAQDRVTGWFRIFRPWFENISATASIEIQRNPSATFQPQDVPYRSYAVCDYFARDYKDTAGDGNSAAATFTPGYNISTPVVGIQTDTQLTIQLNYPLNDLFEPVTGSQGREYAMIRYSLPYMPCVQ